MIRILLILFLFGFLGMAIIIGRHFPRAVAIGEEIYLRNGKSKKTKSVYKIGQATDSIEMFIKKRGIPVLWQTLEKGFFYIEHLTAIISNKAKSLKESMKNRNKIEPKESSYWNEISEWKENGKDKKKEAKKLPGNDQDISNHIF